MGGPEDPEAAKQRLIARRIITESPNLSRAAGAGMGPVRLLRLRRSVSRPRVRTPAWVQHINTEEAERIAAALPLTTQGMDFADALHLTGSAHCTVLRDSFKRGLR